jgi:hypothetical protein
MALREAETADTSTGFRLGEAERSAAVIAQADAAELAVNEPEHEKAAEFFFGDVFLAARDLGERSPFFRRARQAAVVEVAHLSSSVVFGRLGYSFAAVRF